MIDVNIQPTYSSLDYPGLMALVLFIPGCDLRCKYCHNPQLLKNDSITDEDVEEILDDLRLNIDFIDAIVISGGEPLLHPEIVKQFIKEAQSEDLLVKLDTNGLHPYEMLEVIEDLDYVAMDIKAPLDEYYKISDIYPVDVEERITKTMDIVADNDVFLECRTTFVPGLLDADDIRRITRSIRCNQYTLQQFRNRVTYDVSLSTFEEPNPEELMDILNSIDTDIDAINLKSAQYGNQIIKKR